MFYLMGIFVGVGTPALWIALGAIIVISYVLCILIDVLVMRKRAREYTAKLKEYKARNLN